MTKQKTEKRDTTKAPKNDEIKELTQAEMDTAQGGILRNWGLLHPPCKMPNPDAY